MADVSCDCIFAHIVMFVTCNPAGKGKGGRGDKKTAQSSSSKAGLQFPVGRIGRYLRLGKYATRMGAGAPVYRTFSTFVSFCSCDDSARFVSAVAVFFSSLHPC